MVFRIKALWALLTGGIGGVIKYGLTYFNEKVLGKILNKEAAAKYVKDAMALAAFVRVVMEIHSGDLSEGRRESLQAIIEALEELAKALEDFDVTEPEYEAILEKAKRAIDLFKKARSSGDLL